MTSRLATVAALLVLLSVWTYARPRADVLDVQFASAVPLAFGDWVGRDAPPLDSAAAEILAADQYVHRYYRRRTPDTANATRDAGPRLADVEVDIAYYAQPQAGTAMHSPLNCLPGNGWQVISAREASIGGEQQGSGTARELVVARGSLRVAMTYWFQNRGAAEGTEYRQRLRLVMNGLSGRPTDAALVRVMAPDTRDGHGAMNRFARDLAALLTGAFR